MENIDNFHRIKSIFNIIIQNYGTKIHIVTKCLES